MLLGVVFEVRASEWLWLLTGIAAVWITEGFNTALEKLTDLAMPDHHPLAGRIKDISAAVVFMAVLYAGAIGIIVFWPYLSGSSGWLYIKSMLSSSSDL